MLNLHKLFLNAGDPDSFDEVIEPTAWQRVVLVEAKNHIREHLRKRIGAATTAKFGMTHVVRPRFRTQGSWTYRTCVQRAHLPPQDMDWDFGVYLPVSVLDDGRPALMAKQYFDLVEAALLELCETHGWTLDRSTDNCVRVRIARWAHIDVPLYAAPESEFELIMEKALASVPKQRSLRASAALDEAADLDELPDSFWEDMDCIHLATRNGEWRPSDPEAVARWFNDRLDELGEHGHQLRRVCRYLKAWRDYQWLTGGPSSVLLMVIVARAFQPVPRRDDLALENAATLLARELNGDVREREIDDGEEDFNRLDRAQRHDAATRADHLARQLRVSRQLGPGLVQTAVDNVRELLGPRIPVRRELIVPDNGADAVVRTPASVATPAVVGATTSG